MISRYASPGYVFLAFFNIPLPEFLAYCVSTALILVTMRIFIYENGRSAFPTGAKLSFLYCWIGALLASTIRAEVQSENLNWFYAFIGGIVAAALFKTHILTVSWIAGLAMGGGILIVVSMVKAIANESSSSDKIQTPKFVGLNRQFTLRSILCTTSHVAIVVALCNWLTQLYINPEFPYQDLTWDMWYTSHWSSGVPQGSGHAGVPQGSGHVFGFNDG